VPPKEVEPVVLVSEEIGAEDGAAVNQEDVLVVAEYAETEEMMTSKAMISKPFCPK